MIKGSVRCFIVLLITLIAAAPLSAQQPVTLLAKIVDRENQPVPFASVLLIRYGSGVITNADGSFQIPMSDSFLDDTLAISCIGFKTLRMPLNQLKEATLNVIQLMSASIELPMVEIRSSKTTRLTGKKIVAAAINQLKYNHPQGPFAYIAYYRDYQLKSGEYVNMNEAIVKIKDQGFGSNDQVNTKFELIEYKPNTNFPIDPAARQPYDNRKQKFISSAELNNFEGNELATLMVHDPIRNHGVLSFSFIDQFDRNFVNNHAFSLAGQISEGGRILYVINFIAPEYVTGTDHRSTGKIFIEKGNFRIRKLEYSTLERKGSQFIPVYQITVEYALRGSEMMLNYVSFNNQFRIRNPDDFKVTEMIQLKDTAAFIIKFSNQVVEESALLPSNYELRMDGRRIPLDSVRFLKPRPNQPEDHRSVIIYLRDKVAFNKLVHRSLNRSLTIEVSNVKDLTGRVVNVMTFLDLTQYREIFVQQVIVPSDSSKYTEIDKFKPLFQIPPSAERASSRGFWMNPPLKKELAPTTNHD